MLLLNGKETSAHIKAQLADEVMHFSMEYQQKPGLAVVIVGDYAPSRVYVNMKKKACAAVGIQSFEHMLPVDISEQELIALIHRLNADDAVHGILVQLPLPAHIRSEQVIMAIDPAKDVDGFHPVNVGKMLIGSDCFLPCTPYGIVALLSAYQVSVSGQHVVIVGRSNIVGKPLAAMLLQKGCDATVTVCHSRTQDIATHARRADILIAAIGQGNFITEACVKEGAVVVDVGINRVETTDEKGYRIVGDVDFESVKHKVRAMTPVPGGVGPMTIAMLLKNTLLSFKQHHAIVSGE